MNRAPSQHALLIAACLRSAWRATPEPFACTPDELAYIAPYLLATDAGSLAWLRLSPATRSHRISYQQLLHKYQSTVALNLRHEHRLLQAHARLQRAGIEYLVVQGRALAALYAKPHARLWGSIDLCVAPRDLAEARQVLEPMYGLLPAIHVQAEIRDLPDRTWDQLHARSQHLPVGEATVRVLGPEDQLRLLCLHQARHGCWQPLWLCDVAAALERCPDNFSWSVCFEGQPYAVAWIRCVLGLAVELLGARAPAELQLPQPPRWVVDKVVRNWDGKLLGESHAQGAFSLAAALLRPWRLGRALRANWPNPIEARFLARSAPGTSWSNVLFQTYASCHRCASYLLHRSSVAAC